VAEKAVICAGHINWDVVIHTSTVPDPDYSSDILLDHASCGGSSTNTALALSSYDRDVMAYGAIGDDKYGQRAVSSLTEQGVDAIALDVEDDTTLIYAIITPDADPRYLAKFEDVGGFGRDDFPDEKWEVADHVHVTTFNDEIAGELAQTASKDGKTVSFNPTQNYESQQFTDVVDAADVIFLNDREAEIFRSRYDFDTVLEDTCIVMTHGASGSTAYVADENITHSGYPVDDVVDTIGAGDAFCAGFLDKWLSGEDPDLEQALAKGNATGAYSVTQPGAPDSIDTEYVLNLISNQ